MSFDPVPYHTAVITLIDKTKNTVTPVSVAGDASVGNLTQYRLSGMYVESPINRTRYGQMTLRVDDGLFVTKAPILADENTKNRYLIDVQLFQPDNNGLYNGRAGTHFRFDISIPEDTVTETGLALTLFLTGEEVRWDEHLDSTEHEKLTPKESFVKRISHYSANRLAGNSPLIFANDSEIELPDSSILKQDWLPRQPTPTKIHLNEIIERISNPQKSGTANLDYYYFVETSPTHTHSFKVIAKPFGSDDSGVILDSNIADDSVQETDQHRVFDNTKYKKPVILRGKNGSHAIPMELTRHRSDLQHAYFTDAWAANINFKKDDYCRYNNKFYKCLIANTADTEANSPSLGNGFWKNLSDDTASSPWSNNTQMWINCMDGVGTDSDYVGFFHDCNIAKPNYDRADESDEFENVSIKDVEDYLTTPSIPGLKHGARYLVNNGVGTVWEGHNNQIAQYDTSVFPAVWRFSKSPVNNDSVHNKKSSSVLMFDGTLWQTFWTLANDYDKASAFHPVESIALVADHNNVPGRAVEFTYNWNTFELADVGTKIINIIQNQSLELSLLRLAGKSLSGLVSDTVNAMLSFLGLSNNQALLNAVGAGNAKNKAGRWAGFVLRGDKISDSGLIDCINLTESIDGSNDWNRGRASELLGRLRNFSPQVRISFFNKNNELINGISEIPMIYAFRDLFDVTGFVESPLRVNGSWQKIKIPIGPEASVQIHDSRIDELFKFSGFTISSNFYIKKRELTGVRLDWRRIKEIQCFCKDSYDDNLFYKAAQESFLDTSTQQVTQWIKNLAWYTAGIIDIEKVVVDHVKIAISDVSFDKDAYVSSEDSQVTDPREGYAALQEADYYNLKAAAQNTGKRKQYDPQRHTVTCRGDVRLQLGRRFKRRGARINNGEEELVIDQVKHIETGNIYTCEVTGVKKYG